MMARCGTAKAPCQISIPFLMRSIANLYLLFIPLYLLSIASMSGGTLTQVDWDPRSLAEGDVVGLLVTASEGELLIFRNGFSAALKPNPTNARYLPLSFWPLTSFPNIGAGLVSVSERFPEFHGNSWP